MGPRDVFGSWSFGGKKMEEKGLKSKRDFSLRFKTIPFWPFHYTIKTHNHQEEYIRPGFFIYESASNLRKNWKQQAAELEQNYIAILYKLFDLSDGILNSQKLLHGIHWWRGYYFDFGRPTITKISGD